MKYVLPNTVLYAIVVGVGGYVMSFIMAWLLAGYTKGKNIICPGNVHTFHGRSDYDSVHLEDNLLR